MIDTTNIIRYVGDDTPRTFIRDGVHCDWLSRTIPACECHAHGAYDGTDDDPDCLAIMEKLAANGCCEQCGCGWREQ